MGTYTTFILGTHALPPHLDMYNFYFRYPCFASSFRYVQLL
jgi:hypothetical protein